MERRKKTEKKISKKTPSKRAKNLKQQLVRAKETVIYFGSEHWIVCDKKYHVLVIASDNRRKVQGKCTCQKNSYEQLPLL